MDEDAEGVITLELIRSRLTKIPKQKPGGEPDSRLVFLLDLPIRGKRYLFSLAGYELRKTEAWDDRERSYINTLVRESRGRALFVIDKVSRQKLVAIGFSYGSTESAPLLIYSFATRLEPNLIDIAYVLGHVAKRCLHFIAIAIDKPGELLYDVPGGKDDYASSFAFKRASLDKWGLKRVGGTLMEQPPPSD
jgi:hypothetical protein